MTTHTSHLTDVQRYQVDRAREALEASQGETEPYHYPHHCGRLEVALGQALAIISELTGDSPPSG